MEVGEDEATLDLAVVPGLVNVPEVVPKTDVPEAGQKASHMMIPEVVPNHLPRVVQGHHLQEIKCTIK